MSLDSWWTISTESMLAMLRRCHDGEDPELVFMEEYANADHEYVEEDDDQ